MFEKNMKLAYLLDFYGEVLDEHSRSVMRAYYEDDLSLSEIASGEGISRQGVRHIIKRAEEQLCLLEERLGHAAHYSELASIADSLTSLAERLRQDGEHEGDAELLYRAVKTILSKGV